jgi:hypothetical protein
MLGLASPWGTQTSTRRRRRGRCSVRGRPGRRGWCSRCCSRWGCSGRRASRSSKRPSRSRRRRSARTARSSRARTSCSGSSDGAPRTAGLAGPTSWRSTARGRRRGSTPRSPPPSHHAGSGRDEPRRRATTTHRSVEPAVGPCCRAASSVMSRRARGGASTQPPRPIVMSVPVVRRPFGPARTSMSHSIHVRSSTPRSRGSDASPGQTAALASLPSVALLLVTVTWRSRGGRS